MDVPDFRRPAVDVAPQLLGATITHRTPQGAVALQLTEVEAYLGVGQDPASHAYRGKTARNSVMFGPPLHLYVYVSYGMHNCANIVCGHDGEATAVLLRAGRIVDGRALAGERRGVAVPARELARGPARLAIALGIDMADNGTAIHIDDSTVDGAAEHGNGFWLTPARKPVKTLSGARTGVSGPGGDAGEYPWRYWIEADETVSPYRPHRRRGIPADRPRF